VSARDEAAAIFATARERHAAGDVAAGVELARRAIELDPENVEALEHLATVLITRRARYAEGLALIERAVALRAEDAGLWYALGWCCEFAAHELQRRPASAVSESPRDLYQRAAEAFRACLALRPEGKLGDDASDLLDHVENELSRF
jgi:tetratricopeptide (TPR) repeat protein